MSSIVVEVTDGIELGIEGIGPATLLDRGGSAYVYLAEQLAFGREVAIKVLFQALEDPATLRRFERECRAIGAVSDHPNIVVVHGRGLTSDDRPYLVMEYRRGGSLDDQLATRGRFTEAETIQIGSKIGRALSIAHGAGVIHRDVKPGNILLSSYGEPALADFGIARIDGGSKTTKGNFAASVNHASREVLDGNEATIQSDIYSLGSTLFALATGHPPFIDPSNDSVWSVINRVLTTDPPDATDFGVSEPLASVLRSALSHDLSRRYQTASALAEALEALSSGRGTFIRRNADTEQLSVVDGSVTSHMSQDDSPVHPAAPISGNPLNDTSLKDTAVNPVVALTDGSTTANQNTSVEKSNKVETAGTSSVRAMHASAPNVMGARQLQDETAPERRPFLMTMLGAAAVLLFLAAVLIARPFFQSPDRSQDAEPAPGSDQVLSPTGSREPQAKEQQEPAGETELLSIDPILDFRQAEIGPLVTAERYALSVTDSPSNSEFRILLDGTAVSDFDNSQPVFFPEEPGRFQLQVEVSSGDSTAITNAVDLYISPGPPEPGYRVNLASVRSSPSNWPQTLEQFDQLLAQGHDDLVLSLSTRQETDSLPYWNFYIGGFGSDLPRAQEYCDERNLGPDQCFPDRIQGDSADSQS